MLYSKKKRSDEKVSYDYLYGHNVTNKTKKRRKEGRVMLSGKPKK